MNYSTMTERETEIELGTSAKEGITSFTAHDRLIDNGRNTTDKTYAPSMASLIAAQLKNLYTAAFFIMGLVTLIFDFKDGRAAWIIFFAIAAGNIFVGLKKDLEDRRTALKFDERRGDTANIIRDGKETECDPTLLVKGDILVLKKGDFVPADARILECADLKADESIFRKNSVPVEKKSEKADFESEVGESGNMLYCGTVIADGYAKAAVVQTGSETELAKMTESKSKKLSLNDDFAKNTPTEKILTAAALFCAIAVLSAVGIRSHDARGALIASTAAALCLIPASVRFVRILVMKRVSAALTKGRGAQFCEKDFVYDIGSIDCLIFDKGKMLTDSDLRLEEQSASDDALLLAALCSEVTPTETGAEGGGIDAAAVNAAYAAGFDVEKLFSENKCILFKPFDDLRNLMAAVHQTDNSVRLTAKGSVEAILMLCAYYEDKDGIVPMDGEAMRRIEALSSSMAERALKVRAVASKELEAVPESIDGEMKGMVFKGLFGYREVMTPMAEESVKKLSDNFVRPIMVTGDNELTSFAVAKSAGLIKSESDCVSFRDLTEASDEELAESTRGHRVFSNASKADRVRLVGALSRSGAITAVAGEQMTSPSVKLCANVSFGKDGEGDFDVSLRRCGFEAVADIIARCRTMRSNMTALSSLAVAVGLAEALLMIFAALTEEVFPFRAVEMLILNLFVSLFPSLALGLFGHTKMKERGRRAAILAAFHGFIGAILSIAAVSGGGFNSAPAFFAFYAAFDAAAMNFASSNRKTDKNDFYFVLSLILCVIIIFVASASGAGGLFTNEGIAASLLYALAAAAINFLTAKLKARRR